MCDSTLTLLDALVVGWPLPEVPPLKGAPVAEEEEAALDMDVAAVVEAGAEEGDWRGS